MKRSYKQVSQQQQQIVQVAPNLIVDMSILSTVNDNIKKKCPHIRVELFIKSDIKPYQLCLLLRKENKIVSEVKMSVCSDRTITISSNTIQEQREKKYNSILRHLVVLLALTIQYRGSPIKAVCSNANNWKSVKWLSQRKFTPKQVLANKTHDVLQITPHVIQTLQDTQRLKQLMSGDIEKEEKPWRWVQMELDLSTTDPQRLWSALSAAITRMVC